MVDVVHFVVQKVRNGSKKEGRNQVSLCTSFSVWVSLSVAPLILNIGRWKLVVSSMPTPSLLPKTKFL